MKKAIFTIILVVVFAAVGAMLFTSENSEESQFAGSRNNEFACGGEFVDNRDKTTYETVQIGEQCWLSENLSLGEVGKDGLGGDLEYVSASETWSEKSGKPIYTAYEEGKFEEDPEGYADRYGFLYNWHALDQLDLCPEGWSVPSHDDWTILERNICNKADYDNCSEEFPYNEETKGWRGTDTGTRLKDDKASRWEETGPWCDEYYSEIFPQVNFEDCGKSDFNGLPGGGRDPSGDFFNLGWRGYWWTSSGFGGGAWRRRLGATRSEINRYKLDHGYGLSIRCLRD